jgi:hypothetical protein
MKGLHLYYAQHLKLAKVALLIHLSSILNFIAFIMFAIEYNEDRTKSKSEVLMILSFSEQTHKNNNNEYGSEEGCV